MKTTHLGSVLLIGVAATQLGATDCGQVITDRGFDLWCGDTLCEWKLERGEIRQVPTWIEGDDGVEMVGNDVAISQLTEVSYYDGDCIEFHLVGNISEAAEVTLEADVFDDGTIDWSERLPTADWERLSMRIGIAGFYERVRFRLTKNGPGHTVLAAIGAEMSDGCPSYIDPGDPVPAACIVNADSGGTCP